MKLPPQVAQDLINVYLNMKKAKTIGGRLELIGHPVTDAEFEVIEPTTSNDEQRDKSAGDGNSDPGPTIVNRSHTVFTEPTTT